MDSTVTGKSKPHSQCWPTASGINPASSELLVSIKHKLNPSKSSNKVTSTNRAERGQRRRQAAQAKAAPAPSSACRLGARLWSGDT